MYSVYHMLKNNSVMCSLHLKRDIVMIEKCQRHFSKRLCGYKNLAHEDRLAKLGLPSLELRRLHLELIYCYKNCFWTCSIKFLRVCNFQFLLPEAMHISCISQDMMVSERIFFLDVWNSLPECYV